MKDKLKKMTKEIGEAPFDEMINEIIADEEIEAMEAPERMFERVAEKLGIKL